MHDGIGVSDNTKMLVANTLTMNVYATFISAGFCVSSPCLRADVVAVHVVHQAVLVVAQRLVSAVHEHAAAGPVIHAAVAVTSLHHSASGGHDLPRVCP